MNNTSKFDESIYSFLNYSDLDEDEFDDFLLDDFKSKKIKRRLNKKLNNNKIKTAYIASTLIFLSFTIVLFNNSAFASSVIHSINTTIKSLQGDFANYDKFGSPLNDSRVDNGITLTIDNISSDGNEIYIMYKATGDKDFNNIFDHGLGISAKFAIDGSDPLSSYSYGETGTITDANNYSGILKIDMPTKSLKKIFYLNMHVESVGNVNGNWDFKFKIDNTNINASTKKYKINKTINLGDSSFNLKSIEINPISTIIKIDGGLQDFFLLDDKDKLIKSKSGNSNRIDTTLSFRNLIDMNTKTLTFIPYGHAEDYNNYPPIIHDIKPTPFEITQQGFGSLTIKEFLWTNDTLRINYTAKGKLPLIQSEGIWLIDDKGVGLIPENRFNTQISENNQTDFYQIYKGVSKDKTYRIASSRLDKFYIIDETHKFSIDLK
ncbi:DUF4179 domain-containing protein [Clostridium sp. YIM B02505]|uniref:DUF4179 domain-containing protein n=1 Tax=Clostridium yunnanense TaxID=2800325 RepID=A0ABS1EQS4_9CLOT|nr:DUF4179 domain-containing protein [Clostridium yunnanense]MBK1811690.1 DUF4179 domain-containing protein [Clostridium yunnanense]